MMLRPLLAAACLAPSAFGQTGGTAQFILLGSLPEPFDRDASAAAVSADGAIVTGTAEGTFDSAAFRWTVIDGMTDLGPLAGANGERELTATCINGDGSVIAGSSAGGNNRTAWRWTMSSGVARLHLLPATYESFAYGMNRNARFIVGTCHTDAPPSGGYLYDTVTGATTALASVGTGPVSTGARGVSADGSRVIGGSTVWNLSTSSRFIAAPPQGASGILLDTCSDDGSIWVGRATISNLWRATRWQGNVPTLLPMPPRAVESWGLCTDAAGATVGGGYVRTILSFTNNPPTTERRALLWRADLGSVDLAEHAAALGADLQNVVPTACNGASADGRVLVGEGVGPTGRTVAWMLRLPEAVPLCGADLGVQGGAAGADGVLDNNDFVIFIAAFFSGNARADVGRAGGLQGGDRRLDNNDFVSFIDLFFNGCS